LKFVLGDLVGLLDRELLLDKKNPRQSGAATPDVMALRAKRMGSWPRRARAENSIQAN